VRFHSFRSFRGRLVAVFVGLFAVILATCFLVVAAAVRASARHEIGDGKARLDGLAPGTYEARVWQPRMRGDTEKTARPLTLAAGEPAQVAFVVSLKAEWRVPRAPDSYNGAQGS